MLLVENNLTSGQYHYVLSISAEYHKSKGGGESEAGGEREVGGESKAGGKSEAGG